MGVEDNLLLDEERSCTGIFLLFSRVLSWKELVSIHIPLRFVISYSYPFTAIWQRGFYFIFLTFIFICVATFLGYKYCTK
jgi:hypothetical protein